MGLINPDNSKLEKQFEDFEKQAEQRDDATRKRDENTRRRQWIILVIGLAVSLAIAVFVRSLI